MATRFHAQTGAAALAAGPAVGVAGDVSAEHSACQFARPADPRNGLGPPARRSRSAAADRPTGFSAVAVAVALLAVTSAAVVAAIWVVAGDGITKGMGGGGEGIPEELRRGIAIPHYR